MSFAAPPGESFRDRFRERTSLLRKYLVRYRRQMIYGLIMLVMVDLLEIIPPILLKHAVDSIVELRPYRDILVFAGVYFAVLFAQGFCRWGWRVFLIRSSMLAGRDLRGDFATHLFGLPASFYDKRQVGDLMSLANSDTESIRQFLGPGLLTFADALFYLATVPVVMYWLSPELTLLALIPIPAIPFIVWKLESAVHDRYKAAQNQFSALSAMAQENLNGIRVVKAFAREETQYARYRALGEEYARRNLRLARVQSAFGPLMDFFASLGIVLLLWIGGGYVVGGAVTLGTFVAFQRYIQKMIWPMMALGYAASFYQRSLASSARMKEVFRLETDVESPRHPRAPSGKERGRIEVRDLTYAFPGSANAVLRNLSFTVEPGTRVAFLGRVGSGKSTLFSLLPRVYPAPPETIFVDGIPVEAWSLDRLRAEIGFVSQETFLFSESVFENIAFGVRDPSPTARKSRVENAARRAAVDADVLGLVRGYETLLGERGVNLSGGQKQRLSLARALATEPAILIMDDALSAVDVKTEGEILAALRDRPGRNTELIAAHRISTVKEADAIFVLERGEIAESGNHASLIRRPGGIYARFYEEQRLKEDLETYMEKVDAKLGIERRDG